MRLVISTGIGIGAEASARGGFINNGVSNYFTANNGVFLNSVELITWGDPNVAGFEDDDGDGLPNVWETNGITDCDGGMLLDLPGMGAQPDHKDLFVELDWLPGQEPSAIEVQTLKDAFAAAPSDAGGVQSPDDQGVSLWLDTGSLTDDTGALVGDNLGGGNEIPVADIPDPGGEFIPPLWDIGGFLGFDYDVDLDDDGRIDFYQVKHSNFDLIRTRVFRYSIQAKARNEDDNKYPGGQGELGGDDTVIFNKQSSLTIMHELGHNLGLDHGGDEPMNCKPNYVSVMNYAFPGGIPRRNMDAQSQDVDGDGKVDARILDYSPPRFPGGRGRAPIFTADTGLNENHLDETHTLDPTDQSNTTRYFNLAGNGRSLNMDALPDWTNDGDPPDTDVSVDVNGSDEVLGCGELPEVGHSSNLGGADDWSAIQLPIEIDGIVEELVENDNGKTPVHDTPDPDRDTVHDIEGLFNTIDLSITKTGEPDLVMAGQVLTYEIEVTNAGPNIALEVVVEDTLPKLVTPDNLPDNCTLGDDGVVACKLPPIETGASRTLTLPVRVSPRLPCGTADTVTLTNEVSVRNGDWQDVNARDNSASFESQALCLRFEYAAKFVCGARDEGDLLLAAPGRYGTIVNVHNFQSRTLPFFKKLALGFPPAEQKAGEVYPIGIDELTPDATLKADCDDIRQRLFDGELPSGFIDGYLVVQSPRRLDVDAFYSAASAAEGATASARSIHIEHVTERDLRADLVVEKFSQVFPIPLTGHEFVPDFLSRFKLFAVLYTVRVHNDGSVHAENVEVSDVASLALAGPAVGVMFVPDDPFEAPAGSEVSPIVNQAFPPTSNFTVTVPEIAPGDGAEVRFWSLVLVYLSNPQDPANRADLINHVEVSGQGPEVNSVNNTAETLDTLVE